MPAQQLQPRLAQQGDGVRQRPGDAVTWMPATWSRCISPVMRIEPPVIVSPSPFLRRCRPDDNVDLQRVRIDDPQHRPPLLDRRHRTQPGYRQAAAFQRTARPRQPSPRTSRRWPQGQHRHARRARRPSVMFCTTQDRTSGRGRPATAPAGRRTPPGRRPSDSVRLDPSLVALHGAGGAQGRGRLAVMRAQLQLRGFHPDGVRRARGDQAGADDRQAPAPIRNVPAPACRLTCACRKSERRPERRRRLGAHRRVQRGQEIERRGGPRQMRPARWGSAGRTRVSPPRRATAWRCRSAAPAGRRAPATDRPTRRCRPAGRRVR